MRDCTSRLRDEKQVQTQSWLNHQKSENESGPNAGAYELTVNGTIDCFCCKECSAW